MSAAAEHREIAGGFTARVLGTKDWDAPAPVKGWVARDVVRHLVTWFPGFLESGTGIALPPAPSVDDDPVKAWLAHTESLQSVLDEPDTATKVLRNPHLGEMPLEQAISQIYTADVFMHTWDLARATGQDDRLDPERCQRMFDGMQPLDEILRSSGQFGPRVPVPDDADPQSRLLGFIGRDPHWSAA